MKTKIILLGIIVLSGFIACEDKPVIIQTPEPGVGAIIIKFDKPEYKEHIMVYANGFGEGTTRLCSERLVLPDSVIHLCGKSPYIELPNDYLLVDWKWGRIYYSNNEAIINAKWEELKDVDTRWAKSEILVKHPVAEAYWVSREAMRDYNNGFLKYEDTDSMLIRPISWSISDESWASFSDEHKADRLRYIALCDSAQAEFADILSRMISNNALPDTSKIELRYK